MLALTILLGTLALCLMLNIPVAIAIGVTSISYILMFDIAPLMVVAQKSVAGIDNFTLLAIPLFLLAGGLMTSSDISRRIIELCSAMVGNTTGGLALVTILAAILFGAISGSAVANITAIGSILIPHMRKAGYEPGFCCAILGTSGSLGTVIPPSIVLIVYGTISNTSIGRLFMAGVVPGVLCGLVLMGTAYVMSRRNDWRGGVPFSMARLLTTARQATLSLILPVVIVGGIRVGIFTATEAGAIAVLYVIFLGTVVYKTLTWQGFLSTLKETAESTAAILFVITNASIFGWILVVESVPVDIASYMDTLIDGKYSALFVIIGLVLLISTFMETISVIIILTPLTQPILAQYNIDPVHFGILLTIGLAVGANTPPLGIDLMAAARIGRVDFFKAVRPALPFIGMMVVVTCFVILFPGLALFLPDLFP